MFSALRAPLVAGLAASLNVAQERHRRGRPDPGGGESLMGCAQHIGAQLVTLAVKLQEHPEIISFAEIIELAPNDSR
jgi:hypothetical protein